MSGYLAEYHYRECPRHTTISSPVYFNLPVQEKLAAGIYRSGQKNVETGRHWSASLRPPHWLHTVVVVGCAHAEEIAHKECAQLVTARKGLEAVIHWSVYWLQNEMLLVEGTRTATLSTLAKNYQKEEQLKSAAQYYTLWLSVELVWIPRRWRQKQRDVTSHKNRRYLALVSTKTFTPHCRLPWTHFIHCLMNAHHCVKHQVTI